MWNPFDLVFSGVGHVIGSIFGYQLDFLSGKSCRMYPNSTLGVWHCNFGVIFRMVSRCISAVFSVWEDGCRFLCGVLSNLSHIRRRRRRRRDIEMAETSSGSDLEDTDIESSVSYHKEGYRHRRRLWSRKDHTQNPFEIGVDGGDAVYVSKRKRIKHGDVRVIRTSSFAKKGPRLRG